MKKVSMEDWVWFYYKQGFSIIPVKGNDKRPNISTWADFQYNKPTEEQIKHWLKNGLFENIGIISGTVSNNLIIIDIDDESIVDDLGLKLDKISKTGWVVKSGRGYHIYLRSDCVTGSTVKYNDLKIEKRANGGYTVAPPSIHSNNRKYRFINAEKPEDLPELKMFDVKDYWNILVCKVSGLKGIKMNIADLPDPVEHDADCITNINKGVSEGKRNDSAYALVSYLYGVKKLNATNTESLVLQWNSENKPSLPKHEIDGIIKSIINNKKLSGCNKIRSLHFCPYKNKKDCPFINPKIMRRVFKNPPKNLDEVYKRVKKWLFMENTERIDLILAAAITTFHKGKPIWIFFVGASGDAKSELVKALFGLPYVRVIDQITANTLASGKRDVDDLGQELQNKDTLIIITDLAYLISLNKDEKKKIWGQFRNLYDGEIYKDAGSGVINKKYDNCHVTMIACTTSAIRDEYSINQQLGTRELLYGTDANPEFNREKILKALTHKNYEEQMKQELKETMQGFLETREFDETLEVPTHITEFIIKKCEKLRVLRATVTSTDWYSGEISGDAEAEVPTRLGQQLQLLYLGLKSLDLEYPEEKYKTIVENIIKYSSHPIRYKLYGIFHDKKDDWLSIPDLTNLSRIGRKALINQCETLWNMHIIDRKTEEERVGGWVGVDQYGVEQLRGGRIERINYYKLHEKTQTQETVI